MSPPARPNGPSALALQHGFQKQNELETSGDPRTGTSLRSTLFGVSAPTWRRRGLGSLGLRAGADSTRRSRARGPWRPPPDRDEGAADRCYDATHLSVRPGAAFGKVVLAMVRVLLQRSGGGEATVV